MKPLEFNRPERNQNSLVGEFTFFCDEYTVLKPEHIKTTRQYAGYCTYVLEPSWGREKLMAIRFPGATRGHIEIDNNNTIVYIMFYEESGIANDDMPNNVGIYKNEIKELVKQFIGRKVVIN